MESRAVPFSDTVTKKDTFFVFTLKAKENLFISVK